MPFKSIGNYVTVPAAGTPVQLTVNRTNPTERLVFNTLFIQQVAANTSPIYVFVKTKEFPVSSFNKSTGAGVVAIIPAPTLSSGVAVVLPWVSITAPMAAGMDDAANYYIDVDVSSNKALVSIISL